MYFPQASWSRLILIHSYSIVSTTQLIIQCCKDNEHFHQIFPHSSVQFQNKNLCYLVRMASTFAINHYRYPIRNRHQVFAFQLDVLEFPFQSIDINKSMPLVLHIRFDCFQVHTFCIPRNSLNTCTRYLPDTIFVRTLASTSSKNWMPLWIDDGIFRQLAWLSLAELLWFRCWWLWLEYPINILLHTLISRLQNFYPPLYSYHTFPGSRAELSIKTTRSGTGKRYKSISAFWVTCHGACTQ